MSREEVYLYKYDLTDGMAATMGPQMLGMQELEGVWHTAVVCFDHEYLFDGDTGIETCDSPGHTEFGPVTHVISMGHTSKTRAEFEAWNAQQNESAYRGDTYQWFNHNCNHYTHEALLFLTGRGAPDDVINMVPNIAEAPLATLLIGFIVPGGVGGLPPGLRPERDPRARDFLEAEEKRRERRNGGGRGGRQPPPRIGLQHPAGSSAAPPPAACAGPSIVEEIVDSDDVAARTEDMQRTDAMLAAVHHTISRAVEIHSGSDVSPEIEGELLAALHCFGKLLKDVVADTQQYSSPTTGDTMSFNTARRQTECRAFRVSTVDSDEYDTLKRLDGSEWLIAAGWREDVSSTGRLWYALSPSYVASSLQAYQGLLGLVNHLVERVEERHMQRFLDDDEVAAAAGGPASAAAPAAAPSSSPAPASVPRRHADPTAAASSSSPAPSSTPPRMQRANSSTSRQSTGSPPPREDDVRVRDAPLDLDPEDGLLRVEPFRSVASFLAWDCTVERAIPTAAFDSTAEARRHANRTNIASNGAEPKEILAIHDMAGGYHSDAVVSCNARGATARWTGSSSSSSSSRRLQDIPYVPCYWDCVDSVVYFSHALVSPPPPQWTCAAHRHGVRAYGTIKTTDGPEGDLFQALLDDDGVADAAMSIVSRLVALCVYFGFDGWMVDVQQAVPIGPKLDLLHAFMAALKEAMDDIGCRVVLYDSVTDSGDHASCFAATSANARLTAQCHTFVAHYGHHRPVSTHTSPTTTSSPTRRARSLPCIDVFGRGMRDGGDATPSSLRKLLTDNADGVCLFAPAWTAERLGGEATVDASLVSDFKLWAKLHELIVSDDANLRTVEQLPWCMRYDAGLAADGTSQLYTQGTTVLAVPAVGKLVLAAGSPTTTALALGGTGDMGPVLANVSAAALNNAHAEACSRTGVARANSDKIDRFLVVTVCFQAPASGTTAALDVTGDSELATALRLAGTVASSAATPNARALDHCYESVSSEGWITRRYTVRAFPAHHTFTRTLKIRCNVIPSTTGALQDNGRLLLSSIAVDVVPISNPNGRVADPAVLPPRPSPLSSTNSLGRSFPGGVDPTTLCCVTGTGVRVGKAIVVELSIAVKHVDFAQGPRRASESKSYFLRPDGFAPAAINVLVQGEVLARLHVPASGALVSIPLPPGLQSLPPHVAVEYQAVDLAGNAGGVRPLAIAVAAM